MRKKKGEKWERKETKRMGMRERLRERAEKAKGWERRSVRDDYMGCKE